MGGYCMIDAIITLLAIVELHVTGTEVKPGWHREVWVVAGHRAELPCWRKDDSTDQPVLVLWYRSNTTVPVYSYDARSGAFSRGQHWVDDGALGGRADFTVSSMATPTLVLEPALAQDQGTYTCRVDYRTSISSVTLVNLTVVTPPGPPMVTRGGQGVAGVLGPLKEGEDVKLSCRSEGGRPQPELTWWLGEHRLSEVSLEAEANNTTDTYWVAGVVTIAATRGVHGATVECRVRAPTSHNQHPPIVHTQTASLQLNVTLPPLLVRILDKDQTVVAGKALRLVCEAAGSHPPVTLTWWRGHNTLADVEYETPEGDAAGGIGGRNVTRATVTVMIERSMHGVTLSCRGSNPALPLQPPLTDSLALDVQFVPQVDLTLGRALDPDSIEEGDDVYFECSIVSNPHYTRVQWFHNGVEVANNKSVGVIVSGLSLVLRHVRRTHSGAYTCAAANQQGVTTSNPVSLTVKHAPVCAGATERTQGVARGSATSVRCTVEAEPLADLRWTWVRTLADGSEVDVASRDVRGDGGASSVVTVTPGGPEDYGQLLCRATNAVGDQRRPCVITLVPAGPPDAPLNCSAAPPNHHLYASTPNHDGYVVTPNGDGYVATANEEGYAVTPNDDGHEGYASLVVTCQEGFDGGLPQSFQLETWQHGAIVANITRSSPEWRVGHLTPGEVVTFRVVAHNARGRSEVTRLEVHTSSASHHVLPGGATGEVTGLGLSPEPRHRAGGVVPVLGVLAGAGIVVVVVVLLLLIIVRYARHRPPPTHVHTLVMTPTCREPSDTYDPDVVSSLKRPTDDLDVVPRPTQPQGPPPGPRPHSQAVTRTHSNGHTVTTAYVHRGSTKRPTLTRGLCVRRQDSPYRDTESDSSETSDSDSTFTDLTAAGRAGRSMRVGSSHSFPRRHTRHTSAIDLQLLPYPGRGVLASSGVIHNVKGLTNDLRHLPASAEELRHLSSREARYYVTTTGELRQLTASSGELRHMTSSSAELRQLMASTGELRHMATSGEFRQLTASTGELRGVTGVEGYPPLMFPEELRQLMSTGDLRPLLPNAMTHVAVSGGEFHLVPVSGASWHLVGATGTALPPTTTQGTYPLLPEAAQHPLIPPPVSAPPPWCGVQLPPANVQSYQPSSLLVQDPHNYHHPLPHAITPLQPPTPAQDAAVTGTRPEAGGVSGYRVGGGDLSCLGSLGPSQSMLELDPPTLYGPPAPPHESPGLTPPSHLPIQPPPSFREPHQSSVDEMVPLLHSSEDQPGGPTFPNVYPAVSGSAVAFQPASSTVQVVSRAPQDSSITRMSQHPFAEDFLKLFSPKSSLRSRPAAKDPPVPQSPSPGQAKTPPSPPTGEAQPLLPPTDAETAHQYPAYKVVPTYHAMPTVPAFHAMPNVSTYHGQPMPRPQPTLYKISESDTRPTTSSPSRTSLRHQDVSVSVPRPVPQHPLAGPQVPTGPHEFKKGSSSSASSSPEGKSAKGKVKQVTFKDEQEAAVVTRKPAKTEAGKGDKRCAQLFSHIDLSSPSSVDSLLSDSGSSSPSYPHHKSPPGPSKTEDAARQLSTIPERRKGSVKEAPTPVKPPRGSNLPSPVSPEKSIA